MRRRAVGRDVGLTVRLALALSLIAAMYLAAGAVLVLLLVGAIADGEVGATLGALFFVVALPVLLVEHVREAGSLALRAARAEVLAPGDEPQLEALVARLSALADVPEPRVALVRSWSPNAFAVESPPGRGVVAVTTELLRRLEGRELEAVVAHEVAHLANRDGLVMTLVGAPAMLGRAFWRDDDLRMKLLFVAYLPFYVSALLLMWTISRYREYAADRGSAMLTGAPEQLMSALTALGGLRPRGDLRGGAAVSALCIVPTRRRFELIADHPPLGRRLEALAEISRELGKPVA